MADLDRFRTAHWDCEPMVSRGVDPLAFADLFSLDAADELMAKNGLRTPFVRIVKDGVVQPVSSFTGPGGVGAAVGDQLVTERAARLVADGSTVVLQGLHRLWRPITHFTGQLVDELGHPVQANAYLTPPGATGFGRHYDVHDVFVLQVEGRKRWTIRRPVLAAAPARDEEWTRYREAVRAAGSEEPYLELELEPGDALYLPRGWLHEADTDRVGSLHLTIGIHPVTRLIALESLLAEAAQNPALRAALPPYPDLGGALQVKATADVLATVLGRLDPATALREVLRRRDAQTRPEPISPLRQAAAINAPLAHGPYRLRRGLRSELRVADDGWTLDLTATGERQKFGPVAGAWVGQLLDDVVAHPATAPLELTTSETGQVLATLLRLGVLVPMPAESTWAAPDDESPEPDPRAEEGATP